jgi:glycosyltransferase involved in cell wall biosynthesis
VRILFVHNRYLYRGGEDESRALEIKMLRDHGEEVFEYSVDNSVISRPEILGIGLRSIWNTNQYEHIQSLIRKIRPDVMKVDNYFPILSPSVFEAAKSMKVTTIVSVRNYRLVCPSANLFRNGQLCTSCVDRKVAIPAIWHGCYRGSHLKSASVSASTAYAHLRGVWSDSVDGYIAVSNCVKQQLVAGGFPTEKIFVKPNFIFDTEAGEGSGGFALFVGRLTEEKGIRTLLNAWAKVGAAVPLKIIGEGPLQGLVEAATARNEAIEYLGRKTLPEVLDYLGRAMFLVFPAEWLEPFGRAIAEAYSKGTPVIGAETLSIRDMIEDSHTGVLYKSGHCEDLAARVLSLAADPERLRQMRVNARQRYLRDYTEEVNYKLMAEILTKVCLLSDNSRSRALP